MNSRIMRLKRHESIDGTECHPQRDSRENEKSKEIGLSRWGLSLDGPTPEIHDKFRGTPGSFELTIEKIKQLQELNMPLQINTVISRYNYDHLEEMAELVKELKAVMWYIFCLCRREGAN